MKCKIMESQNFKGKLSVTLFIYAETKEEGMEIGLLALKMRSNDFWNVIHKEEAMLEVLLR